MSDVKPVETLAVVEAPKVEDAPAIVESPAAVTEEPAPAATVEAVAEVIEEKDVKGDEAKADPVEPKTITSGLLDARNNGILHFISTRKCFYFQDEPIEFDNLGAFFKKDQKVHPETAQSTAAYACQSGKGLLFFVKHESQKAQPMGIIKLADVVDVTSTGASRFSLKMPNEVLDFIALSTANRDSWVHTIKLKSAEAKECLESITCSEGYKVAFEKFGKKGKEKEEDKEEKDEEKEKEKKDKKKDKKKKEEGAKSDSSSSSSSSDDEGSDKKGKKVKRSSSKKNKRATFFAIIGHKDKKHDKEDKKEDKKEVKLEEEAKVDEIVAGASTDAPTATAEVAVDKPAEETVKLEESVDDTTTYKSGGSKRHSIFSGLWNKDKVVEKKDTEVIKDREIVSDAPPVIAPIGEEPRETTEETKAVEVVSTPPVDTDAKTPSSPPKESFLDKLFKPKDRASPVTAGPSTDVKKDEVPEAKLEEAEAAKYDEAVKESNDKAPEVSSPKDAKRRSSFFSLGKKDKKYSDVKSDTEEEQASKSTPSSPLPRIHLFRKNSKSAKGAPKVDEDVPPVPEVTLDATVVETVVVSSDATAAAEQTIIVAETTTTTTTTTTDAPATTV